MKIVYAKNIRTLNAESNKIIELLVKKIRMLDSAHKTS